MRPAAPNITDAPSTPPVIGRARELAAIERVIDDIDDGLAGLLLEGDAGIGKTTLFEAAIAAAIERSWHVLASRPTSGDVGLSFTGLIDLFDGIDEAVLAELPTPQRHALEVALLRREGDKAAEPGAVSVGAVRVVRALARLRPALIAIDDLQWLDLPTLRTLEFAVRRLRSEPVMLLLSQRPQSSNVKAPRRAPPLTTRPMESLTNALGSDAITRLRIGPMSIQAIYELLHERLGLTLGHPALVRVHEASDGNPLFALELARALIESAGRVVPGQPLPVPDRLNDLLRQRLERLPARTRRVLLGIAAMATPDIDEVRRAFELSPGPGLPSELERAERAGLIEIRGTAVRFSHPLLASVVYATATPGEQRRLHRRLAETTADPEVQARHLALSTLEPDDGMTATTMLDQLRMPDTSFTGEVLRPGDSGYEEARNVHNGAIDKRPALILRCRSTADIAAALTVARESGLEIAVRGGGHSIAGRSATDGGVLIDLSPMKGIVVNPTTRTVRVQGGATWRELNREAAVHELATTGGVISTTGVAGLTLGGGLGWLMGTHGLSVDNLVAVELVTADGEVLDVTDTTQPDLFWALCGGGGNFGIAASLEFRLHVLSSVTAGLIAHPFEAARDLLGFLREYTADAPDELAVMPLLVHAPDGSGVRLAAVAVCHAGSPEQAEADLAPLRAFGSPVLVQVGPMPYPAVNIMLDDAFPKGARYYWKSGFVGGLSDEVIEALVEGFAACPSTMSGIAIEHFHGAVTRVPIAATAVPHRDPSFDVLVAGVWDDPAADAANAAWARATYDSLAPSLVGRRYVNYLSADDLAATADAYGANLARLAELKRRYDPDNVFKVNQNIAPA